MVCGQSRASSMAWWAVALLLALPEAQNPTPHLPVSSERLAVTELLWQLLGYELESYPTDGSRNKLAPWFPKI